MTFPDCFQQYLNNNNNVSNLLNHLQHNVLAATLRCHHMMYVYEMNLLWCNLGQRFYNNVLLNATECFPNTSTYLYTVFVIEDADISLRFSLITLKKHVHHCLHWHHLYWFISMVYNITKIMSFKTSTSCISSWKIVWGLFMCFIYIFNYQFTSLTMNLNKKSIKKALRKCHQNLPYCMKCVGGWGSCPPGCELTVLPQTTLLCFHPLTSDYKFMPFYIIIHYPVMSLCHLTWMCLLKKLF